MWLGTNYNRINGISERCRCPDQLRRTDWEGQKKNQFLELRDRKNVLKCKVAASLQRSLGCSSDSPGDHTSHCGLILSVSITSGPLTKEGSLSEEAVGNIFILTIKGDGGYR